jgi:hypothetical protein
MAPSISPGFFKVQIQMMQKSGDRRPPDRQAVTSGAAADPGFGA